MLMGIASCARDESGGAPSLNADDLWDRMAEERQRPLPGLDNEAEFKTLISPRPPVPGQYEDLAEMRLILNGAPEKFRQIVTSLESVTKAVVEDQDQQINWRTMQLQLSRLTSLQKNLLRAITALNSDGQNNKSLDNGRALLHRIEERLTITRTYLNENKS